MKEQIELIRKDLDSLYKYRLYDWNYTGCHTQIVKHLNVIEEMSQDVLKYKTMWEELKEIQEENEKNAVNVGSCLELVQKLEQKHGIGVE